MKSDQAPDPPPLMLGEVRWLDASGPHTGAIADLSKLLMEDSNV
jgi:hypothetical protein